MSCTGRLWTGLLVVSTLTAVLTAARSLGQDVGSSVPGALNAQDPSVTYRLDLMTNKLVPVSPNDRKVGYIYYHFSRRVNRWAWSCLQADGSFWYPFGEGTTQEGWRFDVRASREQVLDRIQDFPRLAKQMEETGRSACLSLQADGRWKIVGTGTALSIFNAQTGELWQAHGKDYIPVVHTGGKTWFVRNGRHYPSSSSASWQ